MDSHSIHFLENLASLAAPPYYLISLPIPKELFVKDYRTSPQNFGERLRKARIEAGLQIEELAVLLSVTEDTVINWEVRGIRPSRSGRERLSELFSDLFFGDD